jgi:LysR family glycine cleavage system transcriptional activator
MLIEDELARAELVVACERPLKGERAYYLVTPERADERLSTQTFLSWLHQSAQDQE